MMERRDNDFSDATDQLGQLADDDAFITALSNGSASPAGDDDELAGLLLELRDEVEAQMPPAPQIAAAPAPRRVRPWLHGLIGAAAATVLIAGAGAVYVNLAPVDADPAVVELAGKLDEIESRAAEGDVGATRALVQEARDLIRDLEQREGGEEVTPTSPAERSAARATSTVTQTTVSPAAPAPAPEAEQRPEPEAPVTTETTTVVETATENVTQTVTVTEPAPARPAPLPEPTAEPTEAPSETATATPTASPGQQPE